jgi:type IV secretory pathway VirB4 component
VHTLVGVLLKEALTSAERAALDAAILAAYKSKGITADPRTHRQPAPLLADVVAALNAERGGPAIGLARKLVPFTSGAHRMLFDAPTTTKPAGHFVVFSLRDLPHELQAAGTLLALDAIWRTVSDPTQRRRRIVVVDEAWSLMADPAGAQFLHRLAKSARKHWCGLTVVTQDPEDLLGSPLGLAVVQNAATQVLLGQSPQAITMIAEAFDLSDGECRHLLAAQPGEGLLSTGAGRRVAFRSLASRDEEGLVRTGQPRDAA